MLVKPTVGQTGPMQQCTRPSWKTQNYTIKPPRDGQIEMPPGRSAGGLALGLGMSWFLPPLGPLIPLSLFLQVHLYLTYLCILSLPGYILSNYRCPNMGHPSHSILPLIHLQSWLPQAFAHNLAPLTSDGLIRFHIQAKKLLKMRSLYKCQRFDFVDLSEEECAQDGTVYQHLESTHHPKQITGHYDSALLMSYTNYLLPGSRGNLMLRMCARSEPHPPSGPPKNTVATPPTTPFYTPSISVILGLNNSLLYD